MLKKNRKVKIFETELYQKITKF